MEFKKEYDDKLIELGIRDKFVANIEADKEYQRKPKTILKAINSQEAFEFFVSFAFYWDSTPEGEDFWRTISEK